MKITEKAKRDFVASVYKALWQLPAKFVPDVQRLVVAHAALESGWGTAKAAVEGNNLFNLTRIKSDNRPIIEGPDLEYDKNGGKPKRIMQRFRKYPDIVDGVKDYFIFLSSLRYTEARHLLIQGESDFVIALGAAGFYTLPIPDYLKSYTAVLEEVRRLEPKELTT